MARAEPAGPRATEDGLLDGRVRLRQPAAGYRVAIDPVLLAAAVPARAGEHVLDAGSGTGAATLCLAARVEGCRVTGLEVDAASVGLARGNVGLNGLGDRVEILAGDVLRPPGALEPGAFDHVMANPPHHAAGRADRRAEGAGATIEGEARLGDWVRFCLAMVRSGGTFTMIHRADRLDEVLALLAGEAGGIVVFPLWPKVGRPAKRVIVLARPGIATPLNLAPGLVLHGADGAYTAEAEAVLRGAGALAL